MDATTLSDLPPNAKGESSVQHENPDLIKIEAAEEDLAAKLRRKIYEGGLGNVRVPDLHTMSGCSDCDETQSDDDDDICSDSDEDNEESGYNPMTSGVMPPVLPDIQLRVSMEDENDVQIVKNALLIKGVLEVSCDLARQIVTVTGIVPSSRLLKKVRRVNRQAQIISTVSPFAVFINPHFRSSAFAMQEDADESNFGRTSTAIDIPTLHPVPNFVVHQERPRPAFQRYTFHNDPHSPYLRTFSPSGLSPKDDSPFDVAVTGDAYDHHRRNGSAFYDDDLFQFQDTGVVSS
jgi:hypothetical protein